LQRIPEILLKVYDLIILNSDPLILEQLLHKPASGKMVLSGKNPIAIHHPVGRHILHPMATVHSPTHQARTSSGTKITSYSSIRGNPSVRDLPDYLVYALKEALAILFHKVRYKKSVSV